MSLVPEVFLFIPGEWCVTHPNSDNKENYREVFVNLFAFSKFALYEEIEFT